MPSETFFFCLRLHRRQAGTQACMKINGDVVTGQARRGRAALDKLLENAQARSKRGSPTCLLSCPIGSIDNSLSGVAVSQVTRLQDVLRKPVLRRELSRTSLARKNDRSR